jgi:GNAT superfamily N-acetyltransferase
VAADFPFAVSLTDTEHWGFTVDDFARCLAISPDGCFVVEDGGTRAGILTTAVYGDVAWVGNIIVAPQKRGRGLGASIIRHALEHLERAGVRSVRLWAYPHTVALYERFGFRTDGRRSVRVLGYAEGGAATDLVALPGRGRVFPTTAVNWRDVLPFDRQRFGSDRTRVLEVIATGPDHPGFLARGKDGKLVGYLLATRSPKGCEVGPWVVDPAHASWAAPALLDHALGALAGHSVELGVHAGHETALALLGARGFHEGFVTERMVRGTAREEDFPSIFAIGSLERG